MSSVMVLPGCMGSQLQLAPNVSTLRYKEFPNEIVSGQYWADRNLLKGFGLDPMALDGTVLGAPAEGAQAFYSDAALHDYYLKGLAFLKAQLHNTDHSNVFLYPYDWRQSMQAQAVRLANQCILSFTPESPVTIIGHSMGGLIARLAYRILGGLSKTNLIRRIICLGTPQNGTYRIWELWSGKSREGFLFTIAAAVNGLSYPFGLLNGALAAKIIGVTMTWPSLYELLPDDPKDGSDESAFVRSMYTQDFWQYGAGFKRALADSAYQGTKQFLSDGTSVPPGKKLVCIEGHGYPTFGWGPQPRFSRLDPKKSRPVIWYGDGTVLEGGGRLSGHDVYKIACSHDQLFEACAANGLLAELVKENISAPPGPTPPPVHDGFTGLPPIEEFNPIRFKVMQPPPFKDIAPAVSRRGKPRR